MPISGAVSISNLKEIFCYFSVVDKILRIVSIAFHPCLIPSPLSVSRSQVRKLPSQRKIECYCWLWKWRGPQEVERGSQLTASKKIGISVQQLQGTEFCKQSEWSWKQIFPMNLQITVQQANILNSTFKDSKKRS